MTLPFRWPGVEDWLSFLTCSEIEFEENTPFTELGSTLSETVQPMSPHLLDCDIFETEIERHRIMFDVLVDATTSQAFKGDMMWNFDITPAPNAQITLGNIPDFLDSLSRTSRVGKFKSASIYKGLWGLLGHG